MYNELTWSKVVRDCTIFKPDLKFVRKIIYAGIF